MLSIVTIPDVGFSLSGYASVVSVVIGGIVAFILVWAGVWWFCSSDNHSSGQDFIRNLR